MRNSIEKFELKLYELFGIKYFKKFLLNIFYFIDYILENKKTDFKKLRNTSFRISSNYTLGGEKGIEKLKKFKKSILINTSIHIFGLLSVLLFINIYEINIHYIILTILNTYCLILQRYNNIRINQAIRKLTPIEEKQKNKYKEKILDKDQKLNNHTYKIKKNITKEKEISIDEIIEKASLSELKTLEEYLNIVIKYSSLYNGIEDFSLEEKYNKSTTFKIEVKTRKKN